MWWVHLVWTQPEEPRQVEYVKWRSVNLLQLTVFRGVAPQLVEKLALPPPPLADPPTPLDVYESADSYIHTRNVYLEKSKKNIKIFI